MEQLLGSDIKGMFTAGARLLENNKEIINAMNTFPVPDGDTGTNMSLTMRSALAEMQQVSDDTVSSVGSAVAGGSLLGARGNSGVILSQLFRGFAKGLEGKEKITPREFAAAMQSGVHTAYKAVMRPVEGTMLTIARESAKAAQAAAGRGAGFLQLMDEVVQHAEKVLAKTPDMLPVLKEAGVVDAGGRGLLEIYKGFLKYLQGEEIPVEIMEAEVPQPRRPQDVFRTEEIEFGYCTELMIRGAQLDAEKIREAISYLGDSVLAVGDSHVVKIHIHTNNPGQVLEKCISFGSLHSIKVDNMREQHADLLALGTEQKQEEVDGLAVVVVSSGAGLEEIFQSLGVAKVIQGGQTMNPSTEDILSAVKKVPQREIIILPNNKNIIMAARQVSEVCDKKIRVVETRSIPQGIAAMLAFSPEADVDANTEAMEKARKKVKSAAVTYAVCDSKVNGLKIQANDIIGLIEDDIVISGQEMDATVKMLLANMVDVETEVITLYSGEEVSDEAAGSLLQELENIYPDQDVELYAGGQPFYYYLISVE
ncbi:MAG TPA: DAK2 domain-containing protein [Firmicutes bacterium]|nr:DAK2 domain-containing protein [Bacillota bacterium]